MSEKVRQHRQRLNTWIVVFGVIAVTALLSWIIPPGAFDYQKIDVNGTMRSVAVAGSYHRIDPSLAHPAGLLGLFSSLYEGLLSAADIFFSILICAATFSVMVKTGAFQAGIGRVLKKLGNMELVLFAVLMLIFGVGGSALGMLSEFYGFYPLMIGLAVAMGYDAMTGFAVLAVGEFVGFMASTLNPYTVAVAQSIAQVRLYSGLGFRALCFAVFMALSIAYVLRYAARVKRDPSRSVMQGIPCMHAAGGASAEDLPFTRRHGLVMLDLAVTIAVFIWGVVTRNWSYKEICGLFIIMAAAAAFLSGWSANRLCQELLSGAQNVLWGCILTGLSKSVMVVMSNARIMDTIINFLAEMLKNAPSALFIQLMLLVQTLMNFLISSCAGQAAVTLPIMAPLADMLGLSRQAACLAFQFGDGLSNLLWPTANIVIICGMGDIRYDVWLKWFGKLFLILYAAQAVMLQIAVVTGL